MEERIAKLEAITETNSKQIDIISSIKQIEDDCFKNCEKLQSPIQR